jgi:hypothetical protein
MAGSGRQEGGKPSHKPRRPKIQAIQGFENPNPGVVYPVGKTPTAVFHLPAMAKNRSQPSARLLFIFSVSALFWLHLKGTLYQNRLVSWDKPWLLFGLDGIERAEESLA